MSGFSAQWLAMREPADHAARANELTRWLQSALPAGRPLRVLDLACGTGSNLRYLAPLLDRSQHWTLVDHDVALLDAVPDALREWRQATGPHAGISHECRQLDLAKDPDSLDFAVDLVTTTALLDLVSGPWLQYLVRKCCASRAAVLFALSFDGRMQFDPGHAGDGEVHELFNRHQHGDKGFGPALGPDAATQAAALLEAAGYRVRSEVTDWMLTENDRALQAELIDGMASAALDVAPQAARRIGSWRSERFACNEQGRSRLRVGHRDIAAFWPG